MEGRVMGRAKEDEDWGGILDIFGGWRGTVTILWRVLVNIFIASRYDIWIAGSLLFLYGFWILLKGLFLGLLKEFLRGLLIVACALPIIPISRDLLMKKARIEMPDWQKMVLGLLFGILGILLSFFLP